MSGWTDTGAALWRHPELGEIRQVAPSRKNTASMYVWTDTRGRQSAPLPSLPAARVFAARHRVLRYAR